MTVILVDPRRPSLVPVDAIELLSGDVQYTEEMPVKVPWSLPSARPLLTGGPDSPAPVLLSSDRRHPEVRARLAAGERLIAAPEPQPGERLVDAVAIMDKLRTTGPWESEQTHDSLRRYLLEETYELFDAVRGGDLHELRDELGDVLLQVLFHARIAEEALQHSFTIDDVADALVRKLGNRVPAVLAGESISLEDQLAQWEERKTLEKAARVSCVDDVPTGQPALALAQKVIGRVLNAGLPVELLPASIVMVTVAAEKDAENELRTAVLEFMDTVRAVERAIAANRRDADLPSRLDVDAPLGVVSADEWRRHWPAPTGEPLDLPLVPEVVSAEDLPDDLETALAAEEFDVPERAVDDVDLLGPEEPEVPEADQPSNVEPQ
ncbi:nucleoside triphosphate pyrophosphohydrolase [Mycobacterium sp. CVI_P3]|uniref:Nucleoside triphosphate pyrophosphohydrolase n=1 Tax=Mycobacterium pinniadriaticum TaxID=2994102 RepID=A0ABT3SFK0_9MYCO|nr:nucleoside triphosphate pyrophosphohydrolase [Mycobacterium pinniadriaticum]MCX2931119.1 nucleoside triphosphate pyrophosphohydrolase [Mycobacterium pinniadriaticum]MCX2937657.1 nucleoside triphosphate pyrophosphohydrolase [Mycobacterium pinniadriaticum]